MNIRDEEQLQQYFERQMTSGQEQNFLINVAAREDMRLAFRSQLELLKAVREDKDASGSPTFVRSKTLTALGLGEALVPSALKENETQAAIAPASSLLQIIGQSFRRPVVSITAGLLFGILGTAYFMPTNAVHDIIAPNGTVNTAPALPTPEKIAIPAPLVNEPVKDQPKKSAISHTVTSHQAAAKTPIEVVTSNKAGKVGVTNTISKPEDSGK